MEGPLVPIGAFKGTGLSIMTDILCGVLTGAAFGLAPYRDPTNHDVGHMLIAIAIERFLDYDDYLARMRRFSDELKASALAPGFEEILLPGELEHRRAMARLANGIDLDRETVETLRDLARTAGCPVHPRTSHAGTERSLDVTAAPTKTFRVLMLDPTPESEREFMQSLLPDDGFAVAATADGTPPRRRPTSLPTPRRS